MDNRAKYYIKDWLLNREDFSNYLFEGIESDAIRNLSKINILVGSNNSGKSRFMRQLFKVDPSLIRFVPKHVDLKSVTPLKQELKTNIATEMDGPAPVALFDLMMEIDTAQIEGFFQAGEKSFSEFYRLLEGIATFSADRLMTPNTILPSEREPLAEKIRSLGMECKSKLDDLVGDERPIQFDKIYIPTLRGLRSLSDSPDVYKKRTLTDYFQATEQKVFTGLSMYEDARNLLLGSLEEREVIAEFQEFLGQNFFNGQKFALIPSVHSDVLHVKIGDEKEQPIYNLGDGIQSIIILTFPLFANRNKNMLVFIEEPELYLHPGLQRKLLETFMRFENFQYFISTHSNHFLDITLDIEEISIYTFRKLLDQSEAKEKTPKFNIENVSNEDHSVLDLLGVKNSSVFLSNCTIWVEGITDRYYIRRYLDVYQDYLIEQKQIVSKYKEDQHFSFVEYGGGNITHWSFLDDVEENEDGTEGSQNDRIDVDRLCGRLFLISDKDSDQKKVRHEKLEGTLGERYYCLECKEIENSLKADVVLEVIAEYEKVTVDQIKFNVPFTEEAYKAVYLGDFIDRNIVEKKRRGKYSAESGTVSDKVKFCQKAIRHIKGMDQLSDEAKELCRRLFEFIKHKNG